MTSLLRSASLALFSLVLLLHSHAVNAALINFQNCLDTAIVNSNPLQLQWIPLFVDANFQSSSPNNLNLTVWGNVSGQQVEGPYPPPSSPQWNNPKDTFGKIADIGSANKYSTLLANFDVLTYVAYDAKAQQFCPSVINGSCPLGPSFHANGSDPYDLPAFRLTHDFGSPYMFSTLSATVRVISGDTNAPNLACVSANITPDLGPRISGLITWLPAAILILKGIATLTAAIWSPWGTSDIFRWSSNYGRDEDLLRLVTPGFGDCLQYIQFATLLGSLTLQFPGFFQPALSQTSWSLLLFNESFVSHGNGTQSLSDGIYTTNGTYGLQTMSQLIGMTEETDVWACMAIWLLVIAGIVVLLCQLGFFGRWIYRTATKTSEEDLRRKNIPFTLGNMIRLLFNYFILPIAALSLFQLVISGHSPAAVVATAAILLVVQVVAAGWILRIIFSTKPRTYLFDDMPTVLLYGPLYNTYSDSAAPFALVPVLITFMRGVAFGAVQPSGIAQIIILAICEVILILTLNAFRPFQNQTSMNAYHTFFAIARLITVLLSIAFVPSLGVTEAPKGWIGYVILLVHACVLVFGFFLNAAQTLIEVAARSLGMAGHDAQTGAIRGNILTWRMLKKRRQRQGPADRGSMTSNAAILRDSQGDDPRSYGDGGRSRSMSASSQQLLNQTNRTPSTNRISGFENFSDIAGSPSQEEGAAGGQQKPDVRNEAETFYRPPRKRTATFDALTPGAKSRSVGSANDFPYQDSPSQPSGGTRDSSYESGTLKESPAPAFIRDRAESNENLPRPDYAVREVDQYYRGPPLSDQPTRKLKTGPNDPEGPAASAQSWLQRLMVGVQGGKKKEAGKGFEVVRSKPALQPGDEALEMQTSPPMKQEPYRDSPPLAQGEIQASAGAAQPHPRGPSNPLEPDRPPYVVGLDGSSADALGGRDLHDGPRGLHSQQMHPGMRAEQPARPSRDDRDRSFETSYRPRPSHDTQASSRYEQHDPDNRASSVYPDETSMYRLSGPLPPSLAPIETVGGIDMPSRFSSQRMSRDVEEGAGLDLGRDWLRAVDGLNSSWTPGAGSSAGGAPQPPPATGSGGRSQYRAPGVPRRSSRRTLSQENAAAAQASGGTGSGSPPASHDYLRPATNFSRGGVGGGAFREADDDDEDERPASFFNTSHHRAADSIHRNSFGANAALHATQAEFLAGSPPPDGAYRPGFAR